MTIGSLVSVVDDDESVREALPELLVEFGFEAHAFSSAEEFLASGYAGRTACLILDVTMPVMSGPALQQELARRRQQIPILLDAGAVECLFKPFTERELYDAVNAALRVN